MTKKTIDTLVADIDALLEQGHKAPDKKVLEELGAGVAAIIERRLKEWATPSESYLRMSMLGQQDSKIWYKLKGKPEDQEEMKSPQRMKFLYGDVVELVMMALCELAGHTVTNKQAEANLDGVPGHEDADVDDELVDFKSCSEHYYEKFEDGSLYSKDTFGYVMQISGYAQSKGKTRAHFLAMDKSSGHFCLMTVPQEKLKDARARIKYLKEMLAKDTPPDARSCQNPCKLVKEDNGNVRLGSPCTYCSHPEKCHPGARTFEYAKGEKRVLVEVVKTPRVKEITGDKT